MVFCSGVLTIFHHTSAFAFVNWVVNYGPGDISVPTLSEWSLLALAIAVGALGAYALRHKLTGRSLTLLILALGTVLGAVNGDKIISNAHAIILGVMSNAAGGTATFAISPGSDTQLQNTTGVTLALTSITPSTVATSALPTCALGLRIAAGQSCWVKLPAPPTSVTWANGGGMCLKAKAQMKVLWYLLETSALPALPVFPLCPMAVALLVR